MSEENQSAASPRSNKRGSTFAQPTSVEGAVTELTRTAPQPAVEIRPSVDFHIDELVLHGFASTDRHAIAEAVERELTRLFTEQGIPAGLTSGTEPAPTSDEVFEMKPGANAQAIGIELAKALYGGFGR